MSKHIKPERKLCGKCKLLGIGWCCPYFDGMYFGKKLKHCTSFKLVNKKEKCKDE